MIKSSPSQTAARLAALLLAIYGFTAGCSNSETAAFNPPPGPAGIAPNSILSQSTLAGTPVAIQPSVVVVDASQVRLAGATVTFTVTAGGGTVTGATQTTDSNGEAVVGSWILGASPGVNTLSATVDGSGVSGNPVVFSATGLVTAPASVTANSAVTQTATVGTAVVDPPSVMVVDAAQQPVTGTVVVFAITAGGGSITDEVQTTDASGVATVGSWTLGPAAGANALTATVAGTGISGNPVTFGATGAPANSSPGVIWSTFLGGSGEDQIRDVATDAQGNIYAAGGTSSNDFPTTPGAFDRTHDDSPNGTVAHYDVFVTKFDPSGKVIWSTLIGGPGYDRAYAVEVDPQGFVYVAGRAGVGFPVTPGAAQTTFAGGSVPLYGEEDGFVCKLKPDGSALVFCTYFGTTDYNIVRDIDIDANGAVYIASSTTVQFPASATYFNGTYQSTKKGGLDCVIAKLNASGSTFVWATYIGGSGDDGTQPSVRVDGQGNVWYIGGVQSTDLPVANAAQSSYGGGPADLYLAKLSADGRNLLVGTYLGGSGSEGSETHNLAVNRITGDVYVGSATSSTDLPVTVNALQPSPAGGGRDAMVAHYATDGSLLSLTYLGGSGVDYIEGILVGANGEVYASGIGQQPYETVGFTGPGGAQDVAGAIFDPSLSQVVFGVGLGGTVADEGRNVAPMPDGGFVIGGLTGSDDWPTPNGEQPTYGGSTSDALLARISPP